MSATIFSKESKEELLGTLKKRFDKHMGRHEGIAWEEVEARLLANEDKLRVVAEMERTEGEPDVVGTTDNGEFVVVDCSKESPKGRRSVCYDQAALEARKKFPPETSAVQLAKEIGFELLTEAQYKELQTLGAFDLKTSSWVQTPDAIRAKGGALFCDRRYDHVFTYHNGADSYYAARGFRGRVVI
ncbi:DUF4256 domain-containing protein [Paenalkalicoccus suaedae]|uniref:DUF4256 domain-containing protein n=1 Tax=Paenalkalicoccus suaedae TaxID=2592382 RepID=A0A859FE49_9BACI|nr:DUF4256 domain-containing protein [Paenalkalicoccus suaedae]QKS70505.1 DUF4256 domain-containing protein [Paenalkalicoccus suaedae]